MSGRLRHESLAEAAIAALAAADLDEKTALVRELAAAWEERRLSLASRTGNRPPERPGRPEKPQLLPPNRVPRRSIATRRGMVAMLHAIAHIELNAIDLALDIIARFAPAGPGLVMPRSFYDGWVMVAREEEKHFGLLRRRLADFGAAYGDLPAHDGLWESAQRTGHDLRARLAIVPLVLEARGLDVTPALVREIVARGDEETAAIFRVIYEDEKGHVAVGAKWFRFLCHRDGTDPATEFQRLVREHVRGPLKPPFNDGARARSGITPLFYRALSSRGN